MRIWSLHPRYLDTKGLGGVWVETLLAKAVLEGKTKGYTHHPQLNRFRETSDPVKYVSTYLHTVYEEATKRGFKYNFSKVGEILDSPKPLTVTKGQLEYELTHLRNKLQKRSPDLYAVVSDIPLPETHPLFEVVEGGIESWEILEAPVQKKKTKKDTKKETSESEQVVETGRKRKSTKEDAKSKTEVMKTSDIQVVENALEIQGKRTRRKENVITMLHIETTSEDQGRGRKRQISTKSAVEAKNASAVHGKQRKMSKGDTESLSEVKKVPEKRRTLVSKSKIEKTNVEDKKEQRRGNKLEVESMAGKSASEKKPIRGKKIADETNMKEVRLLAKECSEEAIKQHLETSGKATKKKYSSRQKAVISY